MDITYRYPSGYSPRFNIDLDRFSGDILVPCQSPGQHLVHHIIPQSINHIKTMLFYREYSHKLIMDYHDSRAIIPLDSLKDRESENLLDFIVSIRLGRKTHFGLDMRKPLPVGTYFLKGQNKVNLWDWDTDVRRSLVALETFVGVSAPNLIEWYMSFDYYLRVESEEDRSDSPDSIAWEVANIESNEEWELQQFNEGLARNAKRRLLKKSKREKAKETSGQQNLV